MSKHAERAAQLQKDLVAKAREFGDALAKAGSHQDPDLTPDGPEKRRQELVTQVRAKYKPQIDELTTDLERVATIATNDATRARPQVSGDDLAHAWQKVKTRLESGMHLRTILANADANEALAIAEYGPAHMDAEHHRKHAGRGVAGGSHQPPSTEELTKAVNHRLAQVLGDAGAPIADAHQVAATMAGTKPVIAHAGRLVSGQQSNALEAAVASHMAQGAAQHVDFNDTTPTKEPQPTS